MDININHIIKSSSKVTSLNWFVYVTLNLYAHSNFKLPWETIAQNLKFICFDYFSLHKWKRREMNTLFKWPYKGIFCNKQYNIYNLVDHMFEYFMIYETITLL